jgi:hypothetical protein
MKLLSWDQQLGLASPLPYAANQSGKTKTPSTNETGLDASRHTQVSAEGAEKNFLLDILFHRMSAMAGGNSVTQKRSHSRSNIDLPQFEHSSELFFAIILLSAAHVSS